MRQTSRSEYERRHSDPVVLWWGHRSTDKRYAGDNRLIASKSPYRRRGLAPRCRLVASWGWSRSQGYGCSPFKAVRELGSERRETVRSLSIAGVGDLMELPLVREGGGGRTSGVSVVPPEQRRVATFGRDNR